MADQQKKADISTPRKEYYDMMSEWELCRDLMSGTRAMWDSGLRWLPQWKPVEDQPSYENRLKETILFNGFARAVRSLTGKVFKDPMVISEETPEQMMEWYENIDLTGRPLDTFARDCFEDALQMGMTHIFVDRPRISARNRGEEIALGIRPYWVHVPAENLIWWHTQVIDGKEKLLEVRIREVVVEPDGWGLKERKRIRRHFISETGLYEFELYEQIETTKGTEWVIVDAGLTQLDFIPLVTIYFNRKRVMEARPPLMDLAHLNLAHWRSQSLQTHVLSLARRPIPFFHGYDPDKISRIEVGPHSALINGKADASVGFAEVTGASIEAGRQDLNELKDEMAAMAVEVLVRKPGEKTATQTEIQKDESNSELGAMAKATARGLTKAAEITGLLSSIQETGSIDIPTDFELDTMTQEEVKDFISMRTAAPPIISRKTFLIELQRREVFHEEFDVEEEMKMLDLEQSEMMAAPVEEEETTEGEEA